MDLQTLLIISIFDKFIISHEFDLNILLSSIGFTAYTQGTDYGIPSDYTKYSFDQFQTKQLTYWMQYRVEQYNKGRLINASVDSRINRFFSSYLVAWLMSKCTRNIQ